MSFTSCLVHSVSLDEDGNQWRDIRLMRQESSDKPISWKEANLAASSKPQALFGWAAKAGRVCFHSRIVGIIDYFKLFPVCLRDGLHLLKFRKILAYELKFIQILSPQELGAPNKWSTIERFSASKSSRGFEPWLLRFEKSSFNY